MNKELKEIVDKKLKGKNKYLESLLSKGVITDGEKTWYELGFYDCANAIEPEYEQLKIKQQLPTAKMAVKLYLIMSGYNPDDFNPNGAYVKHLKQAFRDAVDIITNKKKSNEDTLS